MNDAGRKKRQLPGQGMTGKTGKASSGKPCFTVRRSGPLSGSGFFNLAPLQWTLNAVEKGANSRKSRLTGLAV
ncbi:MAG: hypothetical protein EA341_16270 [Mongoliibacter sp.]|nr:MAG: hypothetical protein EA341_16270 [Mongoliibacter sp.]